MDSVRQDFGYALRQLRRSPGFTTAAVACLAIGVWLACVVSAVGRGMYRPQMGLSRPDRIVQVDVSGVYGSQYELRPQRRVPRSLIDSLRSARVFAAIGDYTWSGFQLADESKQRPVTALSSGMFGVLGVRPILGRQFVPDEDVRGAGNVVLLSYAFWQSHFGGDSGVVGRELRLEKGPSQTIVGVMPKGFSFPGVATKRDAYAAMGSGMLTTRPPDYPVKMMLARLRDGATVEQVEVAARNIAGRNVFADREEMLAYHTTHRWHYSAPDGPIIVHAEHYYSEPHGPELDRLMAMIIACGFSVVLIACANVANLLLVRGAARRQEIAVRMALGASRARVVMQLIAESVLLSVAGAVVGFLLAFWHWRLLDSAFLGRDMLGQIDRYVALTAAVLGVALVALFGLLPALRASSMRLEQVLRDARRSAMGSTKLDGLMARLVMGSTAGTVVLLASATLLGLSAHDLLSRRRYQTKDVLAVNLDFGRQLSEQQVTRQAIAVLEELSSRPGARVAAIAPMPQYTRQGGLDHVTPAGGSRQNIPGSDVRAITGGYFSTMSIPLVEGRTFTPNESADGVGLVIVNVSAAKRLWPGETAVGKMARFYYFGDTVGTLATVTGVATDVTIRNDGGQSLEFYFPFGLMPARFTTALVRFGSDRAMKNAASMKVASAAPGMSIGEALSLDERARREDASRYLYIGFALFAGAGLILVAVGLYGVIAFSVARRTHEIGVRLALGADQADVRRMIIGQGLRMTLIGTVIGLALSFATAQMLRSRMTDVNPADPRVLILIIAVVTTVSLVASYLPGRRAAKLDPMNALRAE